MGHSWLLELFAMGSPSILIPIFKIGGVIYYTCALCLLKKGSSIFLIPKCTYDPPETATISLFLGVFINVLTSYGTSRPSLLNI